MQFWQPQHDKKLLYGVLKHGWDQWQMILKDELLGVEPVLRQELYLPQLCPQQPPPSSSTLPAAATKSDSPHLAPAAALTQPAAHTQSIVAMNGASIKLPDVSASLAADLAAGLHGKSAAAVVGGSSSEAIKIDDSPPAKAELLAPQKTSPSAAGGESNQHNPIQGLEQEHGDGILIKPASTAAASTAGIDIKPEEGIPNSKEKPEPAVAKEHAALAETISLEAGAVSSDSSDAVKHAVAKGGADSKDVQASSAVRAEPADAGASTGKAEATGSVPPSTAPANTGEGLAAEPAGRSTSTGNSGASKLAEATQAAGPVSSLAATSSADVSKIAVSAPRAAATSSAVGQGAGPAGAAAVKSTPEGSKPPVVLGCPKCRWAPKGCASCRAKWQAAGHVLPAPLAATGSATLGASDSRPTAAAAAALKAERSTTTRLCTWLSNRTTMLASVLKGTHKVAPATASHQPGQARVTVSAPVNRLPSMSTGPIITTQQALGPHSSVVYASGAAYPVQSVIGAPANTGPWQQNAVQLSQMRHQQLHLQQQQRERHTSLLRQQHQSAQLQQQQAGVSQAGQAQALQQQQLRMRQQQQRQGLRQQQLNQQHQMQLQQQLLQQQQRQMTAQQQLQRALVQQGSRVQPQASADHATAAHRAQYQQRPPASQAQTSHPLSESLSALHCFLSCMTALFLQPCLTVSVDSLSRTCMHLIDLAVLPLTYSVAQSSIPGSMTYMSGIPVE